MKTADICHDDVANLAHRIECFKLIQRTFQAFSSPGAIARCFMPLAFQADAPIIALVRSDHIGEGGILLSHIG